MITQFSPRREKVSDGTSGRDTEPFAPSPPAPERVAPLRALTPPVTEDKPRKPRLQKLAWIWRRPALTLCLLLALAAVVYLSLRPEHREYEYVTQTAARGEVVRRITASGKLRPLNTIKVGAEVSGQITKVHVDFNTPVRAGQVLAEIDPTRLRATMEQARAQVSVAEAALAQAQATATRADMDLSIRQRDYQRKVELEAKHFLSKSAVDEAANALAAARAGSQTAVAQVASARAQIAQGKAALNAASLDLSRTTIVAPASGVIINKLVEPGATVAANFQTPNLFEIATDTTRMQVEASVDEADIGQVREGLPVRFTIDSYPGRQFEARVRQIRKAAIENQNVVSYIAILDVDNADGKLLPGMTANVGIILGAKTNVVRIPTAALRFRPRSTDLEDDKSPAAATHTVYVATEDPYKPQRRSVRLGLQGEDFAEVVQGVSNGDKLLVRTRSTVKKHKPEDGAQDGGDGDGTS